MNDELVSIIVPVYNAGKFIEKTIENINQQTYQNWELILVNDKSIDNSVEIINKYLSPKIKLINLEKNMGPANARNRGINDAKGNYICFLDADDLWENTKLEKQVKFMKEKQCEFSFTGYQFMSSDGEKKGKKVYIPAELTYKQALKNTTIFISTVMFDMSNITKDEIKISDMKIEDTATWWRILRNGYVAYGLNEILTFYRRSENTRSSNKVKAIKGAWEIYRKQEKFNILKSLYYFNWYLFNAVKRRI